jgi:hypothetical protein
VVISDIWSLVCYPVIEKIAQLSRKRNESFSVPLVLDWRSGFGTMMHFEVLFVGAIIIEI